MYVELIFRAKGSAEPAMILIKSDFEFLMKKSQNHQKFIHWPNQITK